MNKPPKEKRDQLILVCMGTLFLLILIVFGLIRPQYDNISAINAKISAARNDLQSKEDTIKKADPVSTQLADLTYTLTQAEADMVSGDPALWIYDKIRNFKEHYKVDIAVNSQLSMGEVDMLPHFPYKQLKVTVGGTAYYHDLGKFIADFENTFPHARFANLTLEPVGGTGDNSEKLTFRMDIIALANPTGPQG
ncbi:MAG TPA: hypothetical protein VF430_07480 [Verrucomicrobiae bacterium]|jgi:Tfp pilus assembly protein PilO